LNTSDAALLKTALGVISARPGWGKELTSLLREWLTEPKLESFRAENLRGIIIGLGRDSAVQTVVASAAKDRKTDTALRLLLLETIARASFEGEPPRSWIEALGAALDDEDQAIVKQAVNSLRSLNAKEYDGKLIKLSGDKSKPAEVRLAALGRRRRG
jgi:hypothetical protein